MNQGIRSKFFWFVVFPVFPTSDARTAGSAKNACSLGRTDKPVLSVVKRSLKFGVAESLPSEQRSRQRAQTCWLLARASSMNL